MNTEYCESCDQYSSHGKYCESCDQYSSHGKYCESCGEFYCSSCGKYCESCDQFYCSSHLPQNYQNGKSCVSCNQFYCSSHGKSCASCNQFYCSSHLPQNYQNGKSCALCNQFYCSSHGKSCASCNKFFCSSHSLNCSSCNEQLCQSHIKFHQILKRDSEEYAKIVYCVDQKKYWQYEGTFKNGKQDGVGFFIWPNGLKTMRCYENGKFISEQQLTPQQQVQTLLEDEMNRWEDTKKAEYEKLNTILKEQKLKFDEELVKQDKEFKEKQKQEEEKLNKLQMKLNEDQKKFEEEKQNMTKFLLQHKDPIKLNIGGTFFQTTKSNLTKYSSFFQSMFSGRYKQEKDSEGAYFIDRDGTHFRFILNFMRDGFLPHDLPKLTVEALEIEAHYYQFEELMKALKKYESLK